MGRNRCFLLCAPAISANGLPLSAGPRPLALEKIIEIMPEIGPPVFFQSMEGENTEEGAMMMREGSFFDCFPDAAFYPSGMDRGAPACREEAVGDGFDWTERHLQCLWYDDGLRPEVFQTHDGESFEVLHAGTWNLEAGPDFLGACIRVRDDQRRLEGDVEIHVDPRDWNRHGHADDPRYRGVILHLAWFSGALPAAVLPPGALQAAFKPRIGARAPALLDPLDVAAYPYAPRANPPPCARIVRRWSRDQKEAFLRAAGMERLRRKAERLDRLIRRDGRRQAVYRECMAALGYRKNAAAFRELADRLPVETLRNASAGRADVALAMLAGAAGLLPDPASPQLDPEARREAKRLWSVWWRMRHERTLPAMDPSAWRLDGIRPLNHPSRRLAAAAHWFSEGRLLERLDQICAESSPGGGRAALECLCAARDAFWSNRFTWERPAKAVSPLVGAPRAGAMLLNVVLPLAACAGVPWRILERWLDATPPEPVSRIVCDTAFHLFGPDHPPALYADGLRRQGLLQIFYDFCLNDRSRCGRCRLFDVLESGGGFWSSIGA
jgi:hypothetical protein